MNNRIHIKLLRKKEDLTEFEKYVGINFYRSSDKYPCIAIAAPIDPKVDWSPDGFKIYYSWQIKFLYPDEIQKELYNSDFDEILK